MDDNSIPADDLAVVRKPSAIIYSPQAISEAAGRLVNTILWNEQKSPRAAGVTKNRMKASDARLALGLFHSNNVEFLDRLLDEISGTKIKWNTIFSDAPGWVEVEASSFIQYYSYRKRTTDNSLDWERGYIHYELSSTVADMIDGKLDALRSSGNASGTRVKLVSHVALTHAHAQKLYEFAQAELEASELHDDDGLLFAKRRMTVDELRYMTETIDKYEDFKEFNRRVLKGAIDDVSNHMDISITADLIRGRDRRVHEVDFTFTEKDNFQLNLPLPLTPETLPAMFFKPIEDAKDDIRREHLLKRLTQKIGIPKNTAEELLAERGVDHLEATLTQADRQLASGYRPPYGRRSFLKTFLLKNWSYHDAQAVRLDSDLVLLLKNEFKLSDPQVQSIGDTPRICILDALEWVRADQLRRKNASKGSKISAINAYTLSAIRENRGQGLHQQRIENDKARDQAELLRQQRQRCEALAIIVTDIKMGFRAFNNDLMDTLASELPPNEREELEAAIRRSLDSTSAKNDFDRRKRDGLSVWRSGLIHDKAKARYQKRFPKRFNTLGAFAGTQSVENFAELQKEYADLQQLI
jgi:hypothetical protein